jgi:transcriptional regulator with XRE-family HTH domain
LTTESFPAALISLRKKLNEPSQEGMARRVGCTLGAYSKWERGERFPSGELLLKILLLCPDAESLRAFGIDCARLKEPRKGVEAVPATLVRRRARR